MSSVGTCYGHGIETDVPLEYLRHGNGKPLALSEEELPSFDDPPGELVLQWLAQPPDRPEARLYVRGGGFFLWMGEFGWFRIDPDRREITVPPSRYPVLREAALWGIPTSLIAITSGHLPIHAAAVDLGGQAILIAAPGKHGKTTMAASFHARGVRLLSEDISTCVLDGGAAVLPGPASLRVRRDVYERMPIPRTRVVWTDAERVHLALDPEIRGDGRPVHVRAIVFLRPDHDDVGLHPAALDTSIRDIWSLASKIPTDDFRAACFDRVVRFASAVPSFDLHRPSVFGRLPEVLELLEERFAS